MLFSAVSVTGVNGTLLSRPEYQGSHVDGQYKRIFFSKNLPENGVYFPEEKNAFVLPHQHSRRDVTCKPAIGRLFLSSTFASALLCATELPIRRAYQGVFSLQTIV